jgi:hypothetical protein
MRFNVTQAELGRIRRQDISKIALLQDGFNSVRGSFDSSGDAHKFFGSPETVSREVGGFLRLPNLSL